jgi:DNA-binding YbaB/EbfC family protein
MKDLLGMMGKVREMQARMETMQGELAALTIEGQAGGGLVKATMTGKGDLSRVTIDASLMKPEDAGIVEDLVVAAVGDAKSKVEALIQSKMAELTGGLPIPPGLKLF